MRLLLHGLQAAVVESTPDEFTALRAWFDRLEAACGRKLLVGVRFPAGFAPFVQSAWTPERVAVVQDSTAVQPVDDSAFAEPWVQQLWPHQRAALDAILAARRGVVKIPPGGGKTRVAAALMRAVTGRWLFTVSRATLAEQALRTFREVGLDVAAYEGSKDWLPTSRVVVATTQSLLCALQRDPKCLEVFSGVCADEVHGAGADGFAEVLTAASEASMRCGFSATPMDRADGRNPLVAGLLGHIVYTCEASSLVEAGVLSPGLVHFEDFEFGADAARRGAYNEVYRDLIAANSPRNEKVVAAALNGEKPCLVLVRDLSHGVILQEMIRARSRDRVQPEFVRGSDSVEDRERVFDRVRTGQIDVVIVSLIGEAGLDLPAVATVVNAGAGKSVIASIQRLGRGTRRPSGKFGFVLVDFADRGHPWFEAHARARADAYASTGYVMDVSGAAQPSLPPEVGLLEAGPALPMRTRKKNAFSGLGFWEWLVIVFISVTPLLGALAEHYNEVMHRWPPSP